MLLLISERFSGGFSSSAVMDCSGWLTLVSRRFLSCRLLSLFSTELDLSLSLRTLSSFCFIISMSIFFFQLISAQRLLSSCLMVSILSLCSRISGTFPSISFSLLCFSVRCPPNLCSLTIFLSMDTSRLQLGRTREGGRPMAGMRLGGSDAGTYCSLTGDGCFYLNWQTGPTDFFSSLYLFWLALEWLVFGESLCRCLKIQFIFAMCWLSWAKAGWYFLMSVSQRLTVSSSPFIRSSVSFISLMYIFASSLTSSLSDIFCVSSYRLLKSFCMSFLYYLFLSRLQVERVPLAQRQGYPIWLMMFLHAASREEVSSPLMRLKQAQMASWSRRHLGLILLSMVYLRTMASTSYSLRKTVVPMWLWYFFMQDSQPAAYFQTQQSVAQNWVIRSPCSHLFIIPDLNQKKLTDISVQTGLVKIGRREQGSDDLEKGQ